MKGLIIMSIFSYSFFALWGIGLLAYYWFAKRWQWQVLTVVSVLFYFLSITKIPVVLLVVWIITYFGARYIESNRNKKGTIIFIITLLTCVCTMYEGRTTNLFALLGNSYFGLKAIGYTIDVYRDEKSEKNIFKYLLYLIYWPTILEGPFNRIKEFNDSFLDVIEFDYESFTHGIQRFVWGVFKKLIIAERLGIVVTVVLENPDGMGGKYIILAIIAYAIQLYTDFSGFMDMMLGLSSTFGIVLPENFRQPYFSKSVPEFWRRWHITLGLWFRDYVMFPFTSASVIKRISKKLRKKNKTWGKLFPIILGTCIVWILTGLWHGLSNNYLIWGIYYAIIMCCSQIYNAFSSKGQNVNEKNISLKNLFRIVRTVILVLIADSIICVQGLNNVLILWKEIVLNFNGGSTQNIISTGLGMKDAFVVFCGVTLLACNSIVKEKGNSLQVMLDKSPTIVRWAVYYILIFAILIFGLYDSQYDASQFMYMQF